MSRLLPILFILFIYTCSDSSKPEADSEIPNPEIITNPEYGPWQELEEPPFSFELVQEYNFEEVEEVVVGSIWNFITDEAGNMYMYDFNQNKIYAFDAEGNFRWETGQEGRGPGDIMQARGMVLHNDQIYLSNIGGSRLDIFSLEGEYLSSTSYPKELDRSTILGFSEDGRLVLNQGGTGVIGTTIHVTNFDGETFTDKTSFFVDQSGGIDPPQNSGISFPVTFHNDQIISGAGGYDYIINFYDMDGNIIKKISRDFDKLVGIGIGENRTNSFGNLKIPLTLNNGYWFAHASWPDGVTNADAEIRKQSNPDYNYPDFLNSFDLYNKNGELLQSNINKGFSFELGYPAHVDSQDNIYFKKASNQLIIRKYKLVFADN